MGNLNNLYISQSFQSLAHLGTDTSLVPGTMTELQDGIGQSLNIFFDGTNISSSGNIYGANITASAVNTGSLVTTSSFNAYTSSTNVSISNLNSATSSYVTEAESGSFLITASFNNGTRNLTFTKGNNTTFAVNIPDVSGSTINTGSFATTGSNIFYGDQIISGSGTYGLDITNGIKADYFYTDTQGVFTPTLYGATAGYGKLQIEALDGVNINGHLTASLQQGYVWVGDSSARSMPIPTSSIIPVVNTGSLMVTGSVNVNVLTFTKADGSTFDLTVAASGSVVPGTISSSAQITAFGFVSSSVTASSLITASFNNGTRNLTFTKGDNTQFSLNIPDVSGSTNYTLTSSFNAYTASNDQRVSSLESFSASALISISNLNQSSASQQVSINNLNTTTASLNTSVSNLNTATQSLFVSASLALVTASISNDDITFTKGDGSQFTIQVATGSFALSASFAETASIARNLVVVARNGNPSTLPIGTVVHITSAVGDNPIFNTASYDTELLSANTLGILRQAALSGADVEVVVQGTVTSVNTDPTLGYAAGDVIYLSSSGQFTRVQPQAPNQIVTLGQVLRAQQNNGSIYVAINNGWELNELHNVQINNPQTGDLIQYESSSYGLWKNKSIEGAGITTTSSFNSYTSSTDARLTNIESTTASLLIETNNLELFSASALTSINSLNAATGSYATTGSNNFNGNQIITGSVTISGSATSDLTVVGQIFVSSSVTTTAGRPQITVSGSQGTTTIQRNSVTTRNLLYQLTLNPTVIDNAVLGTGDAIGMTVSASVAGAAGWNFGPAIYVNNPSDTFPAVFGFQNKANYTNGAITALTPFIAKSGLDVTGSTNFSGNIKFYDRNNYDQNVYLGNNALGMGTAGPQPAAVGNTIAVAIGNGAMRYASGSNQNVAIGNNALLINSGSRNFAMGSEALSNNTTGVENIAIGTSALTSNISSSENIAIGASSMFAAQSDRNIAIGAQSLYNAKANSAGNVAIGDNALQNHYDGYTNVGQNFAFGNETMKDVTSGSANVAIGAAALRDAKVANENTFIGHNAGINAQTSSIGNPLIDNTVIGSRAGSKLKGADNTFVGHSAGSEATEVEFNTFIGSGNGSGITNGSYNTLIGGQLTGSNDWNNVIALSDGQGNIKTKYSGSAWELSGSVVKVEQVLQLGQLNPLPTGADGQLAVSASNLYFFSGSAWNRVAFA